MSSIFFLKQPKLTIFEFGCSNSTYYSCTWLPDYSGGGGGGGGFALWLYR